MGGDPNSVIGNLHHDAEPKKRKYSRPQLQEFGKVHHLTQGSLAVGSDVPSPLGKNAGSDPAIKQNAVRIATHPLGFGLYLFDYKPAYRDMYGHGRQFGVMADEVKPVVPDAVFTHSDGHLVVDYGMLGISRTLQ